MKNTKVILERLEKKEGAEVIALGRAERQMMIEILKAVIEDTVDLISDLAKISDAADELIEAVGSLREEFTGQE